MFNRELPGRYTAKLLYGWGGKKIQAEVLEKVRRELEAIEEKSIHKSRPQSVLMDETTTTRRG